MQRVDSIAAIASRPSGLLRVARIARIARITRNGAIGVACSLALVVAPVHAKTPDAGIKTVPITTALDRPWSLAFLPDARMLVSEKSGKLRIVDANGNVSAPIVGVPPVVDSRQGGLLDVQLTPNFRENPQIFFSYSQAVGKKKAATVVARADFTDTKLLNVTEIFRQTPAIASGLHFGSRIVFDKQGNLLVTLGERGRKDFAQGTDNTLGKIIRIRADGSAPSDNPFVENKRFPAVVYSYGHRNPQGAAWNPVSGELWVVEHGPQGGDEVNRVVAGANYGWPRFTYGVNYGFGTKIGEGTGAPGIQAPLHYWVPISIAPSGMAFYNADKVPALRNSLLVGALAGRALIQLSLKGNRITGERRLLTKLRERIRDVRVGPDGYPYLLTDSGKLLRIEAQP